jgi:hypothetical protein
MTNELQGLSDLKRSTRKKRRRGTSRIDRGDVVQASQIYEHRRFYLIYIPIGSSSTSPSASSSPDELDEKSLQPHSLKEILEQEQKDTEQWEQWYAYVMNSTDKPEEVKALCIELMQLDRTLDQFDSWL